MFVFDHVGITVTIPQPGENWVEQSRSIIPPFVVGDFLEVVFIRKYGTIFEYMHYLKDGWFGG